MTSKQIVSVVLMILYTGAAGGGYAQQSGDSGPTGDVISGTIANVSDSAVASTILGLEAFSHRAWNGSNRNAVGQWIEERFLSAGVTNVERVGYSFSGTTQTNVVATIPGTAVPDQEIIVGGHYDAVSNSPGADDNASGTAVAVEAARVLRLINYSPKATLRFIAFSAEEAGLIGSQAYASQAKASGRSIRLMQNYDMIGYRDTAVSDWRVHIVRYSGSEADMQLDSLLMRSYTRLIPVITTQYANASDSYSFWRNGYRVVYSSEMTANPYYHTYRDSTTYVDFAYAAEVARSAVALLLTVDASLTSAPDQKSGSPVAFVLEQNYPNPFNPRTVISFQLSEVSDVTLMVYDILGREVSTLVNGLTSAGRHAVTFDASWLSSGVYVYRLVAGKNSAIRRMMVVK